MHSTGRFLARVLGVEAAENGRALHAQLRAAAASGKDEAPPRVVLDVTGATADTVLDHVTQMYNAAAAVSIATQVNVLLQVRRGSGGGGDAASTEGGEVPLEPLRAADLTPELGYELFDHVAMGGTFDRLHVGHKVLLTYSVLHTRHRLRIGVTGEELLKKKQHAELLQPFAVRRHNVEQFVRSLRDDLVYDVVELTEPSGGTTTIPDVSGMVVSPETLPSVEAINVQRVANGLAPVKPVLINYIGPHGSERVSSTALREAEKTGSDADADPAE